MVTHILKVGCGRDVSKRGLEEWLHMATHHLNAGWGRRQCEQDGIEGTGKHGNSPAERKARKVM